jgi:hypothetical protein
MTPTISQLKDQCRISKIAFKFIHENLIPVVENHKQHQNLIGLIQGPSNLSIVTPPLPQLNPVTGSMLRPSDTLYETLRASFNGNQALHASNLKSSYCMPDHTIQSSQTLQQQQPLSVYSGGLLISSSMFCSSTAPSIIPSYPTQHHTIDPNSCLTRLSQELLAGLGGHVAIVLLAIPEARDIPGRIGFERVPPEQILEGLRKMIGAADVVWGAGKTATTSNQFKKSPGAWFRSARARSHITGQDSCTGVKKFQIESQIREKYPEILEPLIELEKDVSKLIGKSSLNSEADPDQHSFELRYKGKITAVALAKVLSTCGTPKRLSQNLAEIGSTVSFLRLQDPMACQEAKKIYRSDKSVHLKYFSTSVHKQIADMHITRLARGVLLVVWIPAFKNKSLHQSILRGYIDRLIVGLGSVY